MLVTQRAFPIPSAIGRDIEIDDLPPELVYRSVRVIGTPPARRRIPAMQQCKPGTDIAQTDREVDDRLLVTLRNCSPAAQAHRRPVAPRTFWSGSVLSDGTSTGRIPAIKARSAIRAER